MSKDSAPKIKKKQKAYEFIRSQILDGAYVPGFRIVAERVARELGLSVIPVREAIQQLEAAGFIQVIPYSGAVVQLINECEYKDTMEVLAILEGAASARAAKRMSSQEISDLENLNKGMKEALYNFEFDLFTALNRDFHATIYNKCNNAYLIDRLVQAWQRIQQVVQAGFVFAPQRLRGSVEEHDKLIELFKEAAPEEEIEKFVQQHNINTANAIQHRKDSFSKSKK
jgi:DNA-binding GntR family transcriptional regulator